MRTTKVKIVNDNTAEWEVEFYENKQKCKALEIDLTKSKIAKRYSGFAMIHEDLSLLIKWAQQLRNNVDDFEKDNIDYSGKNFGVIEKGNEEIRENLFSLFTAISIIYGRLFTKNKSRLSLERKDHVKPQHYEIHDELVKVRDDYIAHMSDKMYEESKVFVVLNPANESEYIITDYYNKIYFSSSKLIKEMMENFTDISKYIKDKKDEIHVRLIEEY